MKTPINRIIVRHLLFICFTLVSAAVAAGDDTPTINVDDPPYSSNPQIQDIDNNSETALQEAAGNALAADYISLHGEDSLPTGATFKVIWKDGQSEKFVNGILKCSACTDPIPGTQENGSGCN